MLLCEKKMNFTNPLNKQEVNVFQKGIHLCKCIHLS